MGVKSCTFSQIDYFSGSFPGHLTLQCSDPLKRWEVLTSPIYISTDTGQDSIVLKLRMDAVNHGSELQEFAIVLALYGCL